MLHHATLGLPPKPKTAGRRKRKASRNNIEGVYASTASKWWNQKSSRMEITTEESSQFKSRITSEGLHSLQQNSSIKGARSTKNLNNRLEVPLFGGKQAVQSPLTSFTPSSKQRGHLGKLYPIFESKSANKPRHLAASSTNPFQAPRA